MSRHAPRALQLQLDFGAAERRRLNSDDFLKVLARRGCRRLGRVRFKKNRGRIISLSQDGRTLHIHICFQEAPDEVLGAVVTFLKAGRRSYAYQQAVRAMREYWDAHAPKWVPLSPEEEDRRVTRDIQRLSCVGTATQLAFLREAYSRYNSGYFAGRLPAVRLRFSDRMKSRLGHIRYHTTSNSERVVLELALNIHLMVRGNEEALLDTLLHEMTHMEAWLQHSERAHGPAWKVIAERVGCEATACSTQAIRRRRRGKPVTSVPDRRWLPALQVVGEGSAA